LVYPVLMFDQCFLLCIIFVTMPRLLVWWYFVGPVC